MRLKRPPLGMLLQLVPLDARHLRFEEKDNG